MNGIAVILEELHAGERALGKELREVAERHQAEREIFHVARDLARWSDQHVQRLAEAAARSGRALHERPDEPSSLLATVRQKTSALMGRRTEPALLLLRDLCSIYLMASENSLNWEMLAQAAQASRNPELLQLAASCHPQSLRQIRWANTEIKTSAPQLLTSL